MTAPRYRFAVAAAVCSAFCFAAQAQVPLSAQALAQCAQQVRDLRLESERLLRETARFDAQRARILARGQQLDEENARLGDQDLRARLALRERRAQLNRETVAFNAEIDRVRQDIGSINAVRSSYARDCAQRSFDRRDLERLPQAQQDAMRAGLADVKVPYIGDEIAVPQPVGAGP